MKSSKRRVILVDHMAAFGFGHNVECLMLYKRDLEHRGIETHVIASKYLPNDIEGAKDFYRLLYYPYNDVSPVPSHDPNTHKMPKHRLSKRNNSTTTGEYLFRETLANWADVFKEAQITENDTIFFPSADHFGVRSLISFLSANNKFSKVKVHARMIGVMENWNPSEAAPRTSLLRDIKKAIHDGLNISISAETRVYSDYLSQVLQSEIITLTYPCAHEAIELDWKVRPINIVSPGQGRGDKGYFELADVADSIRSACREHDVRLITQQLPEGRDEYQQVYDDELRSKIIVDLLPAHLNSEEIIDVYARSHILIMPYSSETYQLRGSAVYQEGIAFGRPVVAYHGTALADMVSLYENGYVVRDYSAMADAVLKLIESPPHKIEEMVLRSRDKFKKLYNDSLERALS